MPATVPIVVLPLTTLPTMSEGPFLNLKSPIVAPASVPTLLTAPSSTTPPKPLFASRLPAVITPLTSWVIPNPAERTAVPAVEIGASRIIVPLQQEITAGFALSTPSHPAYRPILPVPPLAIGWLTLTSFRAISVRLLGLDQLTASLTLILPLP